VRKGKHEPAHVATNIDIPTDLETVQDFQNAA
jgi:hypothetical protein